MYLHLRVLTRTRRGSQRFVSAQKWREADGRGVAVTTKPERVYIHGNVGKLLSAAFEYKTQQRV